MITWTAEALETFGACAKHLELFKRVFPNGATIEDLQRAAEHGLDIEWLVGAVVDRSLWDQYNSATNKLYSEFVMELDYVRTNKDACNQVRIAYFISIVPAVTDILKAWEADNEALIASIRSGSDQQPLDVDHSEHIDA